MPSSPVDPERVTRRLDAPLRQGAYVLYWMQRAQRAGQNPALEEAASLANRLGLPLLVVFVLAPYPHASPAHYAFMLGGLRETAAELRARGAAFLLERGDPARVCEGLAKEAAAIVGDAGRLRVEAAWREDLLSSLAASANPPLVLEVETEAVVPPAVASGKEEWSAATFRRRIEPAIDHYLRLLPAATLVHTAAFLGLDSPDYSFELEPGPNRASRPDGRGSGGGPRPGMPSRAGEFRPMHEAGARAAARRLKAFLDHDLDRYDQDRNDPSLHGQSDLSPWLHFGQVSPVELAVRARRHGGPGVGPWLEQLIVRRELAVNFVLHNTSYDSYQGLPDWAKRSLDSAREDGRDPLYPPAALEAAATHDPYWNAAQDELVLTGRIHNYMRMYWGKKILEWSASPEEAYATALGLNDTYALDGRDPNGYAGVAWCFGKHDRPWAARPVFGNIRCMTAGGLERKFDIRAYVERVKALKADRNA